MADLRMTRRDTQVEAQQVPFAEAAAKTVMNLTATEVVLRAVGGAIAESQSEADIAYFYEPDDITDVDDNAKAVLESINPRQFEKELDRFDFRQPPRCPCPVLDS
eukprot:CAMPEP_0169123528 /NCGR_PEP_ID=MMETSP1015-20121227/33834_1 /TAXON_ID=342587 /ORGANISM="Karlodinium micrum, Strain CCMP2283" /LENGTH=104 /DNA_ID=CAMNT_0009186873 /DNA_START=48 /DNA_END=362 /DNA_ORIENTATION=+